MGYWNKHIETMGRNELNELIGRKLKYTVGYAYTHSPFYRNLFDGLKLTPQDIESVDSLIRKVPVTTRDDMIRSQVPHSKSFEMFSAPKGKIYTYPYTSGTSGEPKITARTFDDWRFSRECCARAYKAAGLGKEDIVIDFLPYGINVSGLASTFGFYKTVGSSVVTAGAAHPDKAGIILRHKPTTIFWTASYIDRFSRELELTGVDAKNLGIEKILVVGESSTNEKRNRIAEVFGAEVYDFYASDEGDLMAYQCKPNVGGNSSDVGLHVNEDYALVHTVDPDTKKILGVGEEGNDLMTTLLDRNTYRGTVLLNYSHGDNLNLISSEECDNCGRTTKRISHARRLADEVHIGPAKLPLSNIESVLNTKEIRNYITGEYEVTKTFDQTEKIYKVTIKLDSKGRREGAPSNLESTIKEQIYKNNYPVWFVTQPGPQKLGELSVEVVNEGGLEIYKKTGKPRRILINEN